MTVDEILEKGRYADRRGRVWRQRNGDGTWRHRIDHFNVSIVNERYMRLLIERDMHRDECPGMNECRRHPQHHVLLDWEDTGKFLVYEPNRLFFRWIFDTHAEAMDAAYDLAVVK